MKLMTAKEAYEMTIRKGLIKRIANAIVEAIDNEEFTCCVNIDDASLDDINYIGELLNDAQYNYMTQKTNKLYVLISWRDANE